MDVKCERCGTEYEFDDAKVTENGVTVKCTHCGHLFKVVRHRVVFDERPVVSERSGIGERNGGSERGGGVEPEPNVLLPRPSTPGRPRQWMIRKPGGELLEFKDLSTLQRWILERKVSRDDLISKTGENWKPLGSIVELSSFFLVVEGDEGRPTPMPGPTRTGLGGNGASGPGRTMGTPSPAPASSTPVAGVALTATGSIPALRPAAGAPPPPRGRDDLLDTGEFRLEGPEPDEVPGPPLATPHPSRPIQRSRRAPLPPPPEPVPHIQVHRTPARPSLPRQDSFDLGGGLAAERPGNTARGFVIGVVVTGLLFGVAYVAFDRLGRSGDPAGGVGARGGEPAPRLDPRAQAELSLERASVAFSRDTEAGFDRASEEYRAALEALGSPPFDPELAARALAGRARLATTRAEYLRLLGEDPTSLLSAAEQNLAAARELAPMSVDVDLGFADYYRVTGERPTARLYLDRVGQRAADRPELAFVRAALGLYGGDEPAAVAERLEGLSSAARELPRAQVLRAEALRRGDRREAAADVLRALLDRNPDHAPARALLASLGTPAQAPAPQPPPPAPATESPRPIAAPPARPTPPAAAAPRPAAPTPVARPAAPATDLSVLADANYDTLMTRGYSLLEGGRSGQALRMFEEAARKKPQSPEPWANLGWCYVDQRRYEDAITHFRRSLERSPRYADAMYGLAETLEKSGRAGDAVVAYQNYLDTHPRGRKAEMAQRKIERLR